MSDSIFNFRMDENSYAYDSNTGERKNTDIGYNQDEIKATTTEDLIMLRKAIFSYLKSPILKKRNPNYLKLFKRINEELQKRKLTQEEKQSLKSESFSHPKENNEVEKKLGKAFNNKYKKLFATNNECKESRNASINPEFIKRKRAFTAEAPSSLSFPSFLQDKLHKGKDNEEEWDLIFDLKTKSKSSYSFNSDNWKEICGSSSK